MINNTAVEVNVKLQCDCVSAANRRPSHSVLYIHPLYYHAALLAS